MVEILYENPSFLALNKPAGVVVEAVPKGEDSLLRILAGSLRKKKPLIIHRLDKETSGVLLLAKNQTAADYLRRLFKKRLVQKEYLAQVGGRLFPKEGEINVPLKKEGRLRRSLPAIGRGARWAKTLYQVKRYLDGDSLVKVFPKTGRTHQIRAHLSLIGYPIVGDTKYGGRQNARLMLHAASLGFKDQRGNKIKISAPLPPYFP